MVHGVGFTIQSRIHSIRALVGKFLRRSYFHRRSTFVMPLSPSLKLERTKREGELMAFGDRVLYTIKDQFMIPQGWVLATYVKVLLVFIRHATWKHFAWLVESIPYKHFETCDGPTNQPSNPSLSGMMAEWLGRGKWCR